MKLYNTLTKKKETFKPITEGQVLMYNCGPTVYDSPTLGNLRTYVNVDFLRRSLEFAGFKVNEVTNITDIEDKIIKKSKDLGVDYTEITQKYTEEFLQNLKDLNILEATTMPFATKEIPEMIKIIEVLLRKGIAYKSEDGSVYFSISKFDNYGQLSGLEKRTVKDGARVSQDEYDKENAQDFVLWKAKKADEPSWPAPFGEGRPGWHIECTAMSTKYLAESIDLHSGAVDLVFPHHENEIAQSEAFSGKKFVNYWFHTEHLLINGQRMGKSLGNGYKLADLNTKFNVDPLAYRLLCAMSHYRDKLNFTEKSIKDAQNALDGIYDFVLRLKLVSGAGEINKGFEKKVVKSQEDFSNALNDDLSMPKAVATFFDLIKEVNKKSDINKNEAELVMAAILEFDSVFGLKLKEVKATTIPTEVMSLAKKREVARAESDFTEADSLRAKIEKLGYLLDDTADGPIVRKK